MGDDDDDGNTCRDGDGLMRLLVLPETVEAMGTVGKPLQMLPLHEAMVMVMVVVNRQ